VLALEYRYAVANISKLVPGVVVRPIYSSAANFVSLHSLGLARKE
jgi:hypothetical protein